MRIITFILIALFFFSCQSKIETIKSDELGFTIDFPKFNNCSLEVDESIYEETPFGDQVCKKYYLNTQSIIHDNYFYSLNVYKIPKDYFNVENKENLDKYFGLVESDIERASGLECFVSERFNFEGHPAKKMWFENQEDVSRVEVVCVIKNNYEYRMFVIVDKEALFNQYH